MTGFQVTIENVGDVFGTQCRPTPGDATERLGLMPLQHVHLHIALVDVNDLPIRQSSLSLSVCHHRHHRHS